MLALAGGMALLLGVVGLYGVMAYSVSQRTREIGIRLALGAQQQEITGIFVRHALWLAGAGVDVVHPTEIVARAIRPGGGGRNGG